MVASLNEGDDVWAVDGGSIGLGIMVGLIVGSITCLAVLAMLNKKKRGGGGVSSPTTEIESLTTTNGESSVGVVKPESFTIT